MSREKPKITCCTCGHQWTLAQSGYHSCTDGLLKRVRALEAALETAITGLEWWANSDSKYTSENDHENINELKLTLGKGCD